MCVTIVSTPKERTVEVWGIHHEEQRGNNPNVCRVVVTNLSMLYTLYTHLMAFKQVVLNYTPYLWYW